MHPAEYGDIVRNLSGRPIVVASHPRSGTHLTIDLFRRQFRECRGWKLPGERLDRLYLSLEALFDPESRGPVTDQVAVRIVRRASRPLIKTHLVVPDLQGGPVTRSGRIGQYWLDWLRDRGHVVYVYRDGRDVMCSYHLFCMEDHRAGCSLGEFIRQEPGGVSRARAWADHVRRWRAEPGVSCLRFEDMRDRPRAVLERFAGELQLTPLFREPLLPARHRSIWASRRCRLLGIRPQSTALLGRRKGHALQRWRDAFTPEDHAFFEQEAGEVLAELGYD